jgi:SWI/SNF-related matrix-associated actin-dependent regulator of chromatin subfamily A containing DEAD/H box 1
MEALQRSRKTVLEAETNSVNSADTPPTNGHSKPAKKKARINARPKDKMYLENSSNVLMDLRKAASHPMLFRKRFTDDILAGITKHLLKEPDFKKRGALYDLVKEDMTVMTDAELQLFCATYKVSWSKYKFVGRDSHISVVNSQILAGPSLLSRRGQSSGTHETPC